MPQVIADILPQSTLAWRVRLLEEGSTYVEALLPRVKAPTLILAGYETEWDEMKIPDATARGSAPCLCLNPHSLDCSFFTDARDCSTSQLLFLSVTFRSLLISLTGLS